jgi:3-deoxy-D-manno-octulosonate 8-phosphate phosphatase (KDO 8-P phosphatase)
MRAAGGVEHIVIDIDGCMTDGGLIVDEFGMRAFKTFGPDDHDAIREAIDSFGLDVQFVTADKLGLKISEARAEHMRIPLTCCKPNNRCSALRVDPERTVYVGDGYWDWQVFSRVGFGIAPNDAWPETRAAADAVTSRTGGHRAVAQAVQFTFKNLRVGY